MFGKHQRIALSGLAGVIICLAAIWAHEGVLRSIDRDNQEQIIWRCNGNGVGSCIPFSRA